MDLSSPNALPSSALTSRIRSGDFPLKKDSQYGPNGAFRSGSHITLCPRFFTSASLSNVPAVKAGRYIDDQDNKAWTVLHELMHVLSSAIKGMDSLCWMVLPVFGTPHIADDMTF